MHTTRQSRLVNLSVVLGVVLAVAVSTLLVPTIEASFRSSRPASKVSATWSTTKAPLGGTATIKGRVTSKKIGTRTVNLYVYLKSGWRRLSYTHTGSTGYYTMKVPTTFLYSRPLQVRAKATSYAAAATSASKAFTVTPATTPRGTDADWKRAVPGVEQRLDPCRTVTYRFNPANGGGGATADVKQALALTTQATGIKFTQVSQSVTTPRADRDFPVGTDLVITTDSSESTGGAMAPDTLSWSKVWSTREAHDKQGPVRRVVHASIVLNSAQTGAWYEPQPAATKMRVRVLMHEIGSVLGLAPVTFRGQRMMEDVYDTDVVEWGAGDLAGLNRVGLVEGCVTDN